MSNIVRIPQYKEALNQKALECYSQKDYLGALVLFLELFEEEETVKLSEWIVMCYLNLEEYDRAYDVLSLFEKEYQTIDSLQGLYLKTLIKQKKFLLLEIWIQNYPSAQVFEGRYKAIEQFYTQVDNEAYLKIKDYFKDFKTAPLSKQLEMSASFVFLTKKDFVQLAETYLVSHESNALMRTQMNQYLSKLNVSQSIHTRDCFGELRSWIPSNFGASDMCKRDELISSVSQVLENQYPELQSVVIPTVKTHLGLLYPFYDFIEVETFKTAYFYYFKIFQGIPKSEEVQTLLTHIYDLDLILMELSTK